MITDSFEIFCDKYHKRQHLPDELVKYIMNMNTLQIKEEQKEKHKQLFMNGFIKLMNIVLTDLESSIDPEGAYGWTDNCIIEFLLEGRMEQCWWTDEWMYDRWGLNVKTYDRYNSLWHPLFDYSK
jgi:hypothetical protein